MPIRFVQAMVGLSKTAKKRRVVVASMPVGRTGRMKLTKGVKQMEEDKLKTAQKQALLRSGMLS